MAGTIRASRIYGSAALIYIFVCLPSSRIHARDFGPSGTVSANSLFSPVQTDAALLSEEKKNDDRAMQGDGARNDPAKTNVVETIHSGISRSLLASAVWLDSFFRNPRDEAEENRTRALLRYDAFIEEDRAWEFQTGVKISLVLPNLKNKAGIVFAGTPDEQDLEETSNPLAPSVKPGFKKEQNATAALAYLFKSDARRNINARVGVRYRDGDPVLFFRPHYRMLFDLDPWFVRFTQEVAYWTDTQWETMTGIDLEQPIGELFFRTSLLGNWYHQVPDNYFYSLVVSLTQPLSPSRAVEYALTGDFHARPFNRIEQTGFTVRYRQRMWREWLAFELAPQARFPRERNFEPVPGFLFRIEVQFGRYG